MARPIKARLRRCPPTARRSPRQPAQRRQVGQRLRAPPSPPLPRQSPHRDGRPYPRRSQSRSATEERHAPCSSPPAGRASSPTDRRPDRSVREPAFPNLEGARGTSGPPCSALVARLSPPAASFPGFRQARACRPARPTGDGARATQPTEPTHASTFRHGVQRSGSPLPASGAKAIVLIRADSSESQDPCCRPSDSRRPNRSAGENDRPWERFRESSGVRRSSPNAGAALSARGGRHRGRRHRRVRARTTSTPAARPSRSARMRRENARAPAAHWTFGSC